ncbi:MarR family winged helix-turn-helix transcriptional regulator [Nocardia sp. NPDC020380]|uniref:MarR family winged helix-turn-helix transcriptional regulator n=1 Tax=Nocardia sp. NPDC020380 TaxID=3364309 RepID=UPI0037A09277
MSHDSAAHRLRVYHRLQLAAHLSKRQADRELLATTGLTVAQVAVLNAVAATADPTQRQVAGLLGVNESAVTGMVKRLIAAGYLERERSTSDSRAWVLRLTARARTTLTGTATAFGPINAAIDAALGPEGVQRLTRDLEELITRFEATP